jgi:type IV pilus assembly protein PilV
MRMKPSNERGVMLIEALIGILIFSIGILALLGMQAVAMSTTIDAKYRSEAGFLANQIVGEMWSDTDNLVGYTSENCDATPRCAAWLARVEAMLPNATGANAPSITVNGREVAVIVRWQPPGETAGNHAVLAQIYRANDN